jgi:hypothetical protein
VDISNCINSIALGHAALRRRNEPGARGPNHPFFCPYPDPSP